VHSARSQNRSIAVTARPAVMMTIVVQHVRVARLVVAVTPATAANPMERVRLPSAVLARVLEQRMHRRTDARPAPGTGRQGPRQSDWAGFFFLLTTHATLNLSNPDGFRPFSSSLDVNGKHTRRTSMNGSPLQARARHHSNLLPTRSRRECRQQPDYKSPSQESLEPDLAPPCN
jgi:hypothetical protein